MHLHAIRKTSKRRWGFAFGKNEKKKSKRDDHGSGYHITTLLFVAVSSFDEKRDCLKL